MNFDLIIRAKTFEKLVDLITLTRLSDVPTDGYIRLSVCATIQDMIDHLICDPSDFSVSDHIEPEIIPYFDDLIEELLTYDLVVVDVRLLDSDGMFIITAKKGEKDADRIVREYSSR